MRLSPLRLRFLLVGILTAAAVVGAITTTSHFVVVEAMNNAADRTTLAIAADAERVVREHLSAEGTSPSLATSAQDATARRAIVEGLDRHLRTGVFRQAEFALYDERLQLIWSSRTGGPVTEVEGRSLAVRERRQVHADIPGPSFTGILGGADLGRHVIHVPVASPSGTVVLDVVYRPVNEEALIDSMHPVMLLLALLTGLLAVLMMQLSMGSVLRLVDDLRRASDAMATGDLEITLPDQGSNEIGDLARSFNTIIARLRRRAESQTRFLADASHELATPVAGIRGYVNILREWGGEDPDVREESIRAIDRESARMARLCGELLSVVRSQEIVHLIDQPYDLNGVAREAIATAATRYMGKGIEFIGPEEGALTMRGDPNKVEQLLGVLLDNAGKYTDSGGTVRVVSRREDDTAVLEVTDTGIGISEKDLPNVFDRFYRSDDSRSQSSGGFGLGLSIAQNLARSAGGVIEAASVLGEGSTFTVRLPARG